LGIKTDPWDEGAKAAAIKAIDDVLKPYDKQALKAFQDQLTQEFETELTKKLSDSDKANVQVIVNFDPKIK
jgi:DNA-binding LytR/AlgR family response regulator